MKPLAIRGGLSRRGLLAGGGALVVSFSLFHHGLAQEAPAAVPAPPKPSALPGSLQNNRLLDSWIRIDADGSITVFTGKAELGQGIRTALIQVAAEELDVEPADLKMITADTGLSPDEGFTAGSQSMQNSGTAIRNAAAQVRALLFAEAARRWGVAGDGLKADKKAVIAPDGRTLGYGELAAGLALHVEAKPQSTFKNPASFRIMGKPLPRVDIPGKVTGGVAYVQDFMPEGLVHARVVRPPSPQARLASVDPAPAKGMPGVISIVQDGSFLAVIAEGEYQAIEAMRALSRSAEWQEEDTLPDEAALPAFLENNAREVGTVMEKGGAAPTAGLRTHAATFTRPYQIHGSIGPSCAVAHLDGDTMTIWSHTQGVYPDRAAIAEMLSMPPDKVRVIHMEGSGCYGHNGADDAAADAALAARAVPGRPVRVQWMRDQEHEWEPYGPTMLMKVSAALGNDGRITNFTFDLWSNTHATRPGKAGALLAARHLTKPFAAEPAVMSISPSGNGDRNAIPLYAIPNMRVLWHFLPDMPVRVSALRALGAYANVFAIESFMDDLAIAANADPVEFRLRHLEDPRARAVVELAAKNFGWSNTPLGTGRGQGFAFARYKNSAAYFALALEVEVERESGRTRVVRAVGAIDSGEIVNPDGIRNQTEGGILQATSWTLYEAVTFDRRRITSTDWSTYPILRFGGVPKRVDVHVVQRPGDPFLGTGEAAQGPTGAAIGNALRNAIGMRLYDLPLTRDRVIAALSGVRSSVAQ